MCVDKKKSGFVDCGCGSKVKAEVQVKNSQPQPQSQPTSKTEKDVQQMADKYANDEIPGYMKLFGATILIVTLMTITGGK